MDPRIKVLMSVSNETFGSGRAFSDRWPVYTIHRSTTCLDLHPPLFADNQPIIRLSARDQLAPPATLTLMQLRVTSTSTSGVRNTVYSINYAHNFVMQCSCGYISSFFSFFIICDIPTHVLQGSGNGNGSMACLSQCQWIKTLLDMGIKLIKETEGRLTSFDLTSSDSGIMDLTKWLYRRHALAKQYMQT